MLLARPAATPEEGRVVDIGECSVPELVEVALGGDRAGWDELVRRFTPLVLSVTARFRLAPPDAADVSQTVWLQLVQHLGDVREPNALPGWIATAVRHECLHVLRGQGRVRIVDPQLPTGPLQAAAGDEAGDHDEELLRQERHQSLLAGFAELSQRQRDLLTLLMVDPPLSYAEIGLRLAMPVGAIGPTRARALERLRRSPAIVALAADARLEAEVR